VLLPEAQGVAARWDLVAGRRPDEADLPPVRSVTPDDPSRVTIAPAANYALSITFEKSVPDRGVDGFFKAKRFVIHGRDPLSRDEFLKALKEAGVASVKLPARSPNLKAYSERVVRRSSCAWSYWSSLATARFVAPGRNSSCITTENATTKASVTS